MKVLFMTNIPSPYRVTFFNELAKKCDLKVVFEKQKTKVRNDTWFKDNRFNFDYIMLPKNFRKELVKVLKDDYDIIVIAAYYTKVAAFTRFYLKDKKKKYIISADGGFINDKKFYTKYIKRFFMGSASYWLSSGKETSKYLTYYGAKKDCIYDFHFTSITENEILKEPIKYDEKLKLRKKLGFDCKRLFLSIGQITHRKGYDLFLEVMKNNKFKDAKFVIAGDGPLMDEYQNVIEQYKLDNVYFVGFKTKKEIADLYKAADIFFFPTRYDIWGLVTNEALAYGLPLISSDGAISSLEILPKKSLFKVNDVKSLEKMMNEYYHMTNKQLYDISIDNLNRIKKYSIEQMVDDHIYAFNDILGIPNNDEVLLSIICPVYNAQNSIGRLITSIVDQKMSNYELILVNDASTDNTLKEIHKYLKNNDNIKLIDIGKLGVGKARNVGIEKAKGKYITFVDSDDYVSNDYLRKIFLAIKNNEFDLLVFNAYVMNNGIYTNNMISNKELNWIEDVANKGVKRYLSGKYMHKIANVPWNKIYKKEIMDKYNIRFAINKRRGQDLIFNISYIAKIKKSIYINEKLYYYNYNIKSRRKKYIDYMIEENLKYFDLIKEICVDNKIDDYESYLALFFIRRFPGIVFNESKVNNGMNRIKEYLNNDNISYILKKVKLNSFDFKNIICLIFYKFKLYIPYYYYRRFMNKRSNNNVSK